MFHTHSEIDVGYVYDVRYNWQQAIHHSDHQQKILLSVNGSALFVETVVLSPTLHKLLHQGLIWLSTFSGKRCRFHVGYQ